MDRLFVFLILTGVAPYMDVQAVINKYKLVQQEKTWTEAQAYCRDTGTDLATVQTNADFIQLQNESQSKGLGSNAWVGLYRDIDNWRWSLGNEPLGSFTAWLQGEPSYRTEECAEVLLSGWNDLRCNIAYPFICFDATRTGMDRYILYSNMTATWVNAQEYCRTHHTDLASARNSKEFTIIQRNISNHCWIGLHRDTWKWSDQTIVSKISWAPGQPDNYWSNEYCGAILKGQAYDVPCSTILPFFCHSVIMKQIMGVKVQSDQDVNDPSVKAALMEQIKQKLKDHGLDGNFEVNWRKQPNGSVFHKMTDNNTIH